MGHKYYLKHILWKVQEQPRDESVTLMCNV